MRKPRVAIGFLHPATGIAPQFARCLRMLMVRESGNPALQRVVGEFDQESSANISLARCKIVSDFLKHPLKPEWLLMLDADMTFPVDILDRLLNAADEKDRPIMGGLCFGVRPAQIDGEERFTECWGTPLELFPTIYTLNEAGGFDHHMDYPQNAVVRVSSTGAACLLVHRRVLSDPRWIADGHPMPWFRESVLNGGVCSEDHFFHLKAGSLGFPVHINTAARTGHVKVFVADEDLYLAQRAGNAEPDVVDVVDDVA